MSQVTTIGLDLAKNIFQAHGADAAGTSCSVGRCGASRCRPVSPRSRHALWLWRPAPSRTTGVARSPCFAGQTQRRAIRLVAS